MLMTMENTSKFWIHLILMNRKKLRNISIVILPTEGMCTKIFSYTESIYLSAHCKTPTNRKQIQNVQFRGNINISK